MDRVFVTGANGRLGLPLVRALAPTFHVVGLARSEEKARAVREAGAAECLTGDVYNAEMLVRGCDGARLVYHLAGGLRGPGAETPDRLNRQGTANVLEAVRTLDQGRKRLVLASSCAVHGDRSGLWVDGSYRPSPHTRYGQSKADAEDLVREATEAGILDGIIARIAMVYGPGFPVLYEKAIRAKRAALPGEGLNRIPLVHVDDAVAALVLLGETAAPASVIPIVGRDQPTIGEFYDEVARRVGGRPPWFWSTYVPGWAQITLTRSVERAMSHLPVTPRATPDLLRLMTASVRMRPDALERDLKFHWKYPDIQAGLDATLGQVRA